MTASATIDQQVIAASKPVEKVPASRGEKVYSWLVYTGLNYWANLAASLVICDYFTHGAGHKHLDKIIQSTEKTISRTGLLSSSSALKTSTGIWKTMALTSGGVMASLLTKPLEDNKRPIVHWLNKKLGIDQTAADGHEMTADEIPLEKEQPPQTWWNVIKRRIYSSIVIVTAGAAINHTVGLKNIENKVVGTVNTGLKSGYVPGGKAIAENQTFQRYLGYAALDSIFAAVHAVMMKMTNGAFDPHCVKKSTKAAIQPESHTSLPDEKVQNEKMVLAVPIATHINMDQYKTKKILPMGSYADRVSASDPTLALAV